MKVLIIDPRVHTSLSKTYKHYDYLYDELKKYTDCFLYQSINFNNIYEPLTHVREQGFNPDIIYFGMGYFALSPPYFSKNLKTEDIDIPCVGFLYKPQNFLSEKLNFLKQFTAAISSIPNCKEYEKTTGIEFKVLSQAGDEKVFYDRKLEKIYDIGFSGALHDNKLYVEGAFKSFNIRSRAQEILLKEKNLSTFLNGSDDASKRLPTYEEYAKKINQCRMWIATPAPFEEITGRYYEIGMSNTLLFCSEIPKIYETILVDGKNCVTFDNNLNNFLDKFYYYLNNWQESEKIVSNAFQDFHNNHTWDNRAQQLYRYFKKILERKYEKQH